MRRSVVACVVFVAVSAFGGTPRMANEKFREAVAAYQAKDFAGYLAAAREAAELAPNAPRFVFNLAGALALNGRGDEAVATLQRLVVTKVPLDLSDRDFDSIRTRDEFHAVERAFDAIRHERRGSAETAFALPKGLVTEAVAVDAKTGAIYVTSVRTRRVLRVGRDGTTHDFATRASGLWAGNGMAIDAQRRVLWVTSSAHDVVEGYDASHEGEASLLSFDVDDGRLLARYALPGKSFFDDLTLAADGTVYVSEALHPSLWQLRPGETALTPLVAPGVLRSPQGSAVIGNTLYVADYSGAIFAVDRRTGDAVPIALPADLAIAGVDGLEPYGRSLIAVQNGFEPSRVLRLRVSDDGLRVTRADILLMNDPRLDEPTLGAIIGDTFLLNAASQQHYLDPRAPHPESMHEAPFLRIPLR